MSVQNRYSTHQILPIRLLTRLLGRTLNYECICVAIILYSPNYHFNRNRNRNLQRDHY